MLTIEAIPAFDDNYIWCLFDSDLKQAAVIDPGEHQPVIDFLESHQLTLSHILITHHHYDHVNGVCELKQRYNATVYGPHNPSIKGIDHAVNEADSFTLFNNEFSVMEVPGHTLDHIAFFAPALNGQPIVFCGDTLFAAGCGRLFEGTPAMMQQSLTKLAELPGDTLVYCTHEYTLANIAFARTVEPSNTQLEQREVNDRATRISDSPTLPSNIALELSTNPFLRCDSQEIIEQASQFTHRKLNTSGEVFAAIREWKNHF